MDEYQFGAPASDIQDTKVINFDLSSYDLSDKKQKKAAEAKMSKSVSRFLSRQRKSKGFIWSGARLDTKAGTASLTHSQVGQMCVEAFEEIGEQFKFNCPITGEYFTGANWLETH